MSEIKTASHGVILENRSELSVSGVKEVIGFDEETVIAETELGTLTVKGKDLKVMNFTVETGSLNVEGTIAAMCYTDTQSGKNFLKRLFG